MSAYYYNFWKWNPFLEIPRFKENKGTVQYCYNENKGVKDVIVLIKQSPLSIDIAFTTNEIKSDSIIGNIVKENSQYILFYTYITTPSSQYSKDNPIQRGTCRLELIIKKDGNLFLMLIVCVDNIGLIGEL